MAINNPKEIASLIVKGREYTEWESVWVQERWTESFSYFRFTANEGRLQPPSWRALQFKPTDDCTISLGGVPVINGVLITRQASATATQHMVQHTGKSYGFWPYKSTAYTEDGNFDGKNFEEIAAILLKDFGGYEKVGILDPRPFEKEQVDTGMTVWDYLEKLARSRGVILGVHRNGRPLLIGKHTGEIMGHVTDGDNILQIQCTISCENFMQDYLVDVSEPGDDQKSGKDVSQIEGRASGRAPKKSVLVVNMENPEGQAGAQMRAQYEKQWCEATEITCNVTVQGWFSQDGSLWEAGKCVAVYSPIAMITQTLKAKTVTFQQDNNTGTTTTLELVAPWGFNDNLNIDVGDPQSSVATGVTPEGPQQVLPAATGSPASAGAEPLPTIVVKG